MKSYDHSKIEKKWQKVWEKEKLNQASDTSDKPKFYSLVEFPYPSGDGLHVGHPRPYIGMDIISRKRRMEGFNVLYPIGWDAFGLPTENYAIKVKKDPRIVTKENIKTFTRQIRSLAISFDWSREVNTTDPEYYKWTQWIFLKFLEHGLAYKAKMAINWCPKDKIGLANEEVVNGCCERCGTPVEKREKEQWMLAITKYAERLDKDLDTVDYLPRIKTQQRNWIGKSEGAEIEFPTSKKYTYVLLHGFEGKPTEGKYSWLKKELEAKGHIVIVPELPHTNAPVEDEQVKMALNATQYDENTILYGHSLGSVVAMKVLEELKKPIAGLIISGAFRDPHFLDEWQAPFEKTFTWEFNVKKIKENVGFIEMIHDIKDDGVSMAQCERLEQMIGVISKKVIAEKHHFDGEIEPELLKILSKSVKVFTTHPDTIFGATYLVLSPEHELIPKHQSQISNYEEVVRYVAQSKNKTEIDRTREGKEKTGIELKGLKAINPATKEEIPVWIADYVLAHYGTGAIMAVPADDERDGAFAEKFNLPIIRDYKKTGFKDFGKKVTTFKLRDWVFSRQRYWGEPIPVVHCEKCGIVPLRETDLPLKLPKVKNYQPTDTGESPLASVSSWVNTKCPKCKGPAKRETDTMPNWAGSSWYFLRYCDPHNDKEFASMNSLKYWMTASPARGREGSERAFTSNGVDWYNGGMEHTTLHLLYSRFWNKFLYDLKLVPTSEPYKKRTSHGLILGEDGEKMSKSRGNVINPDGIVKIFGADTLRVYEMFMGPFDQSIAWSNDSMVGPRRFLEKVWRLSQKVDVKTKDSGEITSLLHKTIEKVGTDIETMAFNTAISTLMIFTNELEKQDFVSKQTYETLLCLLSPFAPHVTEELWSEMGYKKSIHIEAWPIFDPSKISQGRVKVVIQVGGKTRGVLEIERGVSEGEAKERVLQMPEIKKWVLDKKIVKVFYVPDRLINLVLDTS